MQETEQTLLFVGLFGNRFKLLSRLTDLLAQLFLIQFLLGQDHRLTLRVGLSRVLHFRANLAHRVVDVRFAHSAGHAIHFQRIFQHFQALLPRVNYH